MRELARMNTLEPGNDPVELGDRTPPLHTRSSNDDATDRRLKLLIGLVVVLAVCAAALHVLYAVATRAALPQPLALILIYALTIVSFRLKVMIRVRSNQSGYTWAGVPMITGLVLMPVPWVVLGVLTYVQMRLLRASRSDLAG